MFGLDAEAYSDARPRYPERVYEILTERCGLSPASRVLEIGAGSGQATHRLLEAGAEVVAVEPNERLAARLALIPTAGGRLNVIVSPFEETSLAARSFDLAVSATAFHWLDAGRALPMIRSLLRANGWLAIWWNVFGDPDAPDAFHEATRSVLEDLEEGPSAGTGSGPYALDAAAREEDLAGHGFDLIEYESLPWTLVLTAGETRRLYSTYSSIARLPDPRRTSILDEIERIASETFEDRVERRMLTPVYTARVPAPCNPANSA